MDFTLKIFRTFLEALLEPQYRFIPFSTYLQHSTDHNNSITFPITDTSIQHFNTSTLQRLVVLRHDVDRLPENALQTAIIEHELDIKGTYYFRVVPESYNLKIMEEISQLGHEIGYHYEDVDLVVKRKGVKRKGVMREGVIRNITHHGLHITDHSSRITDHASRITDHASRIAHHALPITDHLIDAAYESFSANLEMFRKHFDIKTICMHGSPRSRYDNRLIWSKYDYRELGIIGEPYFDIDFQEVAYFTDTGRRWNGDNVNIRDKVNSNYNFDFKTTYQIIDHIDRLPAKIMFTIHPQRWHNRPWPWLKELLWQNVKNQVKRFMRGRQ